MKGISVVICFLVFGMASEAQNLKVLTAWNSMKKDYIDLEKAKEAIDAAAVHANTRGKARTWYYRGMCYYKLYKSKDVKLKNLDPNPLKEAYISYVKAKDLDRRGKYSDTEYKLRLIRSEFFNKGSLEFQQKKYRESLQSFIHVMDICELPYINMIDSGAVFSAAIAADRAGLYEKALYYYNKSIKLKYKGCDVYHYVAKVYMAKGDTNKAIQVYNEGIDAYPSDNGYLYIQLVNYYLQQDNNDKVAEYSELAVERYPKNASLWNVYGMAFEDRDQQKSVTGFKNAMNFDSTFFEPYYNLGTYYYNQGVDANDVAMVIPLDKNDDYLATIAKRDNFFEMALPYYERAIEIDSNSSDLLIALKEIYIRLEMPEKIAGVTKLIEDLK